MDPAKEHLCDKSVYCKFHEGFGNETEIDGNLKNHIEIKLRKARTQYTEEDTPNLEIARDNTTNFTFAQVECVPDSQTKRKEREKMQ